MLQKSQKEFFSNREIIKKIFYFQFFADEKAAQSNFRFLLARSIAERRKRTILKKEIVYTEPNQNTH
jgi:hypothetical protein